MNIATVIKLLSELYLF